MECLGIKSYSLCFTTQAYRFETALNRAITFHLEATFLQNGLHPKIINEVKVCKEDLVELLSSTAKARFKEKNLLL